MKIDRFRCFNGRNIYSHRKCIRMDVDLEGYSNIPTKSIANFNETIINILPKLSEHRCGIDEKNGFLKRLEEGTYLAHVCEHVILCLQNMIGMDVRYGKAREIYEERYYIIYEYVYKDTAIQIGKIAVDLVNSLINGTEFKLNNALKIIENVLRKEEEGPSTLAILKEAKKRNIPVIRLSKGSMFQLGYGKYSKIIEATIDNNTNAIGVDIACDKLLAKEMLYDQCLPVPEGDEVKNGLDLLFKANKIGYPIVLKPRYGNQGKGVLVNIKDEKEAIEAYKVLTKKFGNINIMIEKYIIGKDYRVCMVDGEVVAVAERIPPYIIGDGIRNIKQLIEEVNKNPMRGQGHEKPLTKIKIDEEVKICILKKGYDLQSVITKGEKLILRENANLSTGGEAIDCTELICEENISICKRTAQAIGLNICGIDICCKDIKKNMTKDGAIMEVNAAPGIRMHHYPAKGKSRNVAAAIVDMMFKNTPSNIPVVSITGTNGKTTTTRLIGYVLNLSGYTVGMTTTGGIYVNNTCIEKGDTTGYNSAMTVLTNKEIDAAVLETARGGIIRKGLAYDMADIGVITNITEDHLGIDGVENLEDLALVKALVGEAVKDEGYVVINADDPISISIINRIKSNIIMFSKDKYNPLLMQHMKNGGYGVYVYEDIMYVEKKNEIVPIVKVEEIMITLNGKLTYNIENAMAACAALAGLNVKYSIIRRGLITFYGDENFNPGRFNIYNINGIQVVLDYGHNIEGYKAVINGAKNISHKKLVGVIGVPGDRTDDSVERIGLISGKNFDYIYIKEDKDRRGRKSGEIANIIKNGIIKSGFDNKKIETILDEKNALEKAIDNAKKGDLIIVFFEKLDPLVKLVKQKMNVKNKKSAMMM